MLMGIFLLTASGVRSQGPTFHSILTKDKALLTPDTYFSLSDRISLNTIWDGLTGTHEETVLWIEPEEKVHETTRFLFTVPSGNISCRTSACCLNFNKKRFFLSARQIKYIGHWRVQLFLDGKFLSEYSFYVS
ncbi:MAG: hypothetical protein ABSE95_04285 [Thermodesulfobacteriota bacterium]|jgi:hypothetical protein